MKLLTRTVHKFFPAKMTASAHCDGPCGIYDPASARIAAEAALSMTKKILSLDPDDRSIATANSLSRFITIKEQQAQLAKTDLLILWTDYFKPQHLEQHPDLHDIFWKAAKLCSAVKVEVDLEKAAELMSVIEKIHNIFWATKERDVPYYTAG